MAPLGSSRSRRCCDELELRQSGEATIANLATDKAVVLPQAFPNTNYSIHVTFRNTVDVTPLTLIAVVTTKATTGFTVDFDQATDSANYVLEWSVEKHT